MSGVRQVEVPGDDADIRLDRWLKRRFPALSQGRIERLLRTGQIRVDGHRVKAGSRLAPGQIVRIPPFDEQTPSTAAARPAAPDDGAAIQGWVLYSDDDVIALNKPAGLAVQGGAKTTRHVDGMLDALAGDRGERPKLVHRLDRDTSGVLLLARTGLAARTLTAAFRGKTARKLYWAAVIGVPRPEAGRIDASLVKSAQGKAAIAAADDSGRKHAVTLYRTMDTAGKRAAWLALTPLTGRTHQIRVHCAAIGTPILGDGKYGGAAAFLAGLDIPRQIHLHARRLVVPHPRRGTIDVTAPIPPHMAATWSLLGFDRDAAEHSAELV